MSELQQKVDTLNALLFEIREYKEQHPQERLGYYLSVPSLLNAYREGDIDFDSCVAKLKTMQEDDLVYVPGDWLCPQCHFRQHQRTLYARTGDVGINRAKPDNCPNDGTPMERLTWKQDAEAANQIALDMIKENRRLRERLDEPEPRH